MENSKKPDNDLNAASKTESDLQKKLNTLDNLIKIRSAPVKNESKPSEEDDEDGEILPGYQGIF